ncbi:hypothetical protein POSPLADRAFT_1061782 [Postia placenta MAD-698-R-SB12]|uniref:Ubiquitin-like protease family profile domain-containing protein n=1 Tax=Postia placenta MAD-698-R-SB12 TaxID=670580 RepID=A0A1X6MKZ7_9APHY|nr:hypothetical protein POSPLADRAFT_1061782 [Postia placenta MAD-698-R-SB12]OSX57077.1 hypothetical protein POSPLADRAFT_1061782 [Postia placenta MAD-698-R-SB12]
MFHLTPDPVDTLVDNHDAHALSTPPPVDALTRCARLLSTRCPACFGGAAFGRSFDEGADIHVALDATFSQRHSMHAGDSPHFYEPEFFIPKAQVDECGRRIIAARKKPPRPSCAPKVPAHIVDECEKSYKAADEKKVKTSANRFDDTGVMALICRHNIPIFLANVDTPGEQQKYAIALLEHLFTFLPPNATVAALYDIGCVVDRSLELYNILPVDIHQRLIFAISTMHAYGHQWACQIVYNPRLREGLGLTDGEGIERLWSRLCKLIPITRSSAAKVISLDLRDDLGHWIAQRLRHGVESREASSLEELARVGIPKEELRDEWKQQCVAQTSIRAHAPAHLKKELDVVLSLQADLDTVNKAIETTRTVLENGEASAESHEVIARLERSHTRLVDKVEALYSSLNITDSFPDFRNISLEFVRLLLMAHDLKINIRKRAVGSFFEWDRLDQAVGGRHNPLGTKIHQQTRKAIAKRTPALKTAIRKFNHYCETLKELKQPEWTITVPLPLPTDLDALRDDASLLADVWIDPSQAQAPRWLEDVDVRKGIRVLLLGDHCLEERHRLGREADNICRWYGSELAAAKLALATSSNADIAFLLQQRVCELLLLPAKWKNPLVSPQRFDAQTTLASETVNSALGDPQVYAWPFVIETPLPYIIHQDDTDPYGRLEEEELSYLEAEQHLVEDVFLDDASGDEGPPEDARSEASVMTITMTWETPIHVSIDDAPHFLQATAPVLLQLLQSNVHLDVSNMSRLQNRSAWMNDSCINACMQLLQLVFLGPGGERVALLSTYMLPLVRADAGDATLWRNAASTRFWEKDVWTIPIHYKDHWMLATIDIPRSRVAYFDSFAREHPWEGHIQDVMQLTARLLNIAADKGHCIVHAQRAWAVYPTTTAARQHNTYDCGVWILAVIAAVLRGYDMTGFEEADIGRFRIFLFTLARAVST